MDEVRKEGRKGGREGGSRESKKNALCRKQATRLSLTASSASPRRRRTLPISRKIGFCDVAKMKCGIVLCRTNLSSDL